MQRSRTTYVENGGRKYLVVELEAAPNLDHIETVSGSRDEFYVDWQIADTRRVTGHQRRLFFALLHDIESEFVVPQSFLKELFYTQYSIYTAGGEISLSNHSKSSVSDGNILLDLVIDFMFEWNVPFKAGYELLPKEQEYYLYQCCRHRRCMICGKQYSDIHHIETVGSGVNRTRVDHSKYHVMCLCREHHITYHNYGPQKFSQVYHIPVTGIKLDQATLRKLGIKGDYERTGTNEKAHIGG